MALTQETLNLILLQIALWYNNGRCCHHGYEPMSQTDIRDSHPGGVHDVSLHIEDLLEKLHGHQLIYEKVSAWVHTTIKAMYTLEIY